MKYGNVGGLEGASRVILGCMRITQLSLSESERLIQTALENGINYFDHADIYGGDGASETQFAKAFPLTSARREQIYLQSKCGIRKGYYDFSKEHILESVDGSLARLHTDYLDVLLLHRPDALVEPEEVAEAFDRLKQSGKVRAFGVSNHSPMQMKLLKSALSEPLVVNQLQFSLAHTCILDSGIALNMNTDQSVNRDGGVLDYCRCHNVTVQAWSPFQHGFFKGSFVGDTEHFAKLNEVLERLASKYEATADAVASAWILRHPAGIQVVTGTTKPQRVTEACRGCDFTLERQEWYELYRAAGNMVP